jgi:hypothetical protein
MSPLELIETEMAADGVERLTVRHVGGPERTRRHWSGLCPSTEMRRHEERF